MLFSLSFLLLLAHPALAQFPDLGGLKDLLGGLTGGSMGMPTVDTNGNVQNGGSLIPSGFQLPTGFSLDDLKAQLAKLPLDKLGFNSNEAQSGASIGQNFPGLQFLNGLLSNKPTADGQPTQVGADVVTASPFDIVGQLQVLKDKALQTLSSLSLKDGASLNLDAGSSASAGVLQLLKNNLVNVGDNAQLKAGLLLINDAQSKINGSFQIINEHLAKIAAGAKLQLGDAASGANADKLAEILAKFNVAQGGALDFAGATKLLQNSQILGDGDVTIKKLLDLSQVQLDMAQAQAQGALIQAKSLALDKLAELKLKVQTGSATLLDIKDKLMLDGAKIDINGAADIKATILKLLHGQVQGKADISVDGQKAVDVTAGKVAPPANGAATGNVWTVNYGDKETTLELKSADEVYVATTAAVVGSDVATSSSVSVAVAAVVVAVLSSMN